LLAISDYLRCQSTAIAATVIFSHTLGRRRTRLIYSSRKTVAKERESGSPNHRKTSSLRSICSVNSTFPRSVVFVRFNDRLSRGRSRLPQEIKLYTLI